MALGLPNTSTVPRKRRPRAVGEVFISSCSRLYLVDRHEQATASGGPVEEHFYENTVETVSTTSTSTSASVPFVDPKGRVLYLSVVRVRQPADPEDGPQPAAAAVVVQRPDVPPRRKGRPAAMTLVPNGGGDDAATAGEKAFESQVVSAFVGIMVSSYFWGYQADTRGRQIVLKYALYATSGCSLASSFATNFSTLLTLRITVGLCVSAASAVAYTYLGEFCTDQKRGQSIAYASAMIPFGIVYCACFAWFILSYDWRIAVTESFSFRPWRLLFIVFTIPALLCGIAFSFLPESPKFLLAQNRADEALSVLQKLHRINFGRFHKQEYPVTALNQDYTEHQKTQKGWNGVWKSMQDQTIPLSKMPQLGYMIICCINAVNVYAVYGSLCFWFPLIMNQVLSDPSAAACSILQNNSTNSLPEIHECDESVQTEAFLYTIVLGCIGMFCSLMLSLALKKISTKILMIVNTAVASIAGILLQFVTTGYLVAALFSVEIMFSATGVTLINAGAVSLFPTHVKGMAVSLINMAGRCSCFALSSMIGILMAHSCPATMYAFAGMLLLSSGLTILLP